MTTRTLGTSTSFLLRGATAAAALCIALASGACADSDNGVRPDDVSLVEWTSSFGFCAPSAYCTTRLRVTGQQAVVTLESRQSPTITRSETLSTAEADAIAAAAAQVRFEGLGSVIGCPDCADGGAESISVTADGKVSTVTFEYNASVAGLEPLLSRTRTLVARIRPAR
jgi:hypothetical protein